MSPTNARTDGPGGVELAACPFCGGPAASHTYRTESLWSHDEVEWLSIGCSDDCDYSMTSEAQDELIARWNRRAAAPRPLVDEGEKAEKLQELYGWTGSAFLAGEKVKGGRAEEQRLKGELYSFLCRLIGWFMPDEGSHGGGALRAAERSDANHKEPSPDPVPEGVAGRGEQFADELATARLQKWANGNSPYVGEFAAQADARRLFARIAELEARALKAEAERDGLRGAVGELSKAIDDSITNDDQPNTVELSSGRVIDGEDGAELFEIITFISETLRDIAALSSTQGEK